MRLCGCCGQSDGPGSKERTNWFATREQSLRVEWSGKRSGLDAAEHEMTPPDPSRACSDIANSTLILRQESVL